MLKVLVGNDFILRSKKLNAILSVYKKSGEEICVFTDVNFDPDLVLGNANNISLFGNKNISVISGVSDDAEKMAMLENIVKDLVRSEEIFILNEKSLSASFLKKLTTLKCEIEKFEEKKSVKGKENFDVFAFTDTYASRKRSMSWAMYRKGISSGSDSRELHGKIFWITKNLLLVKKVVSAEESGLHPFVYGKTKTFAKNFSEEELEKNLMTLCEIFHESMLQGFDLETSLESFILNSLAK